MTYNGSSFDLPVLRYRAMINRVAAPGLECRRYWSRFSDDCLDLCDALACFSPGAKVSLDHLCRALDIPCGRRGAAQTCAARSLATASQRVSIRRKAITHATLGSARDIQRQHVVLIQPFSPVPGLMATEFCPLGERFRLEFFASQTRNFLGLQGSNCAIEGSNTKGP